MLLLQAPKFQHIIPILKSLHWLKVSERIEYKIISLTYKILNTTQPSYHIYSASSRSQHTLFTLCHSHQTIIITQSLTAPYDMLHLIFGTSYLHHSGFLIQIPNYSSPSQRPSFEHAGLTCYTLLSPSITFSLFHSELKTYVFRNIILHLSRTDLMALDCSPDLFVHRFYILVLFFLF